MRRELRAFRSPQVWLVLGIGSVGFIGFFAVYTDVAPAVTEYAGLDAALVPVALITMGAGMTVGNLFGGWLADRSVVRAIFVGFGLFALSLLGYALTAASPAGMFFFLFAIGATDAALSPAIQTRLINVAGDSQTSPRPSITPPSTSATASVRCSAVWRSPPRASATWRRPGWGSSHARSAWRSRR